MSPPFFLDLDYEITTPLFLSGPHPTVPELRAASIRGAVRAWYRAIDPRFLQDEVRWMGAADQPVGTEKITQQSPWLLRVMKAPSATFQLDRNAWRRFDRGNPPERTNGVLYTGFSLLDRFNSRKALAASEPRQRAVFTLRLIVPRSSEEGDGLTLRGFTAVLGAFWLLGHLGGLGSRARRAWGSVQLRGVTGPRVPPAFAEVVQRLQPAPDSNPAAWRKGVGETLAWLRERLHGDRTIEARAVPHWGEGASAWLLKRGHQDWAGAVDDVGARMQAFRRQQWQDRKVVLEELMVRHGRPLTDLPGRKPEKMTVAPRRVAFGLPLTFRFGLTPKRVKELRVDRLRPDALEFVPAERARDDDGPEGLPTYSRFPGLVSLRVVRLADGWHGLVVRLAGASPGAMDVSSRAVGNKDTPSGPQVVARVSRVDRTEPLRTAGDGVLEEWLRELRSVCDEVRP